MILESPLSGSPPDGCLYNPAPVLRRGALIFRTNIRQMGIVWTEKDPPISNRGVHVDSFIHSSFLSQVRRLICPGSRQPHAPHRAEPSTSTPAKRHTSSHYPAAGAAPQQPSQQPHDTTANSNVLFIRSATTALTSARCYGPASGQSALPPAFLPSQLPPQPAHPTWDCLTDSIIGFAKLSRGDFYTSHR